MERLRFLRRRMGFGIALPANGSGGRKFAIAGVVVLLTGIGIPGYKTSVDSDRPLPHLVPRARSARADKFANVWLVDKRADFETYSNGLRIDDQYAVSNENRLFYPVYQQGKQGEIVTSQPEWRSEPAGIIFHTTESDQARFEAGQNGELKRIGKAVLTFVQQNRSYHFLIDRFGQVFRVVPESDVANHAGNSIWADETGIYVNLNNSFLGIAFETQTQRADESPSANEAQIHSARVLTEMLRGKYHIPASNCVTHAQVSVNPANMLIGYHTDWAGNFPFHEVGLNDNYPAPPASIYVFGFDYDPAFVHATGARLWEGLALAEERLRSQAAARGLPVSQYRSIVQKQYKEIIDMLKASTAPKEHAQNVADPASRGQASSDLCSGARRERCASTEKPHAS